MHSIVKAAVLAVLVANANAKTIKIDVGEDGLTYNPNSVTADKGDILQFEFYGPHSVLMADWSKGCSPAATGGFFSGIVNGDSSGSKQVFQVTVSDTSPMAFFCTVPGHCQAGMVGVVNPTADDSLAKFKATASSSTSGKAPSAPFGGKLVDNNESSSSAGGSSSAAPSSTVAETSAAPSSSAPASSAPASSAPASSAPASSAPLTTAPGNSTGGAGSQTATATATHTSVTAAAAQLQGPVAGIGALAMGIAAFLV